MLTTTTESDFSTTFTSTTTTSTISATATPSFHILASSGAVSGMYAKGVFSVNQGSNTGITFTSDINAASTFKLTSGGLLIDSTGVFTAYQKTVASPPKYLSFGTTAFRGADATYIAASCAVSGTSLTCVDGVDNTLYTCAGYLALYPVSGPSPHDSSCTTVGLVVVMA